MISTTSSLLRHDTTRAPWSCRGPMGGRTSCSRARACPHARGSANGSGAVVGEMHTYGAVRQPETRGNLEARMGMGWMGLSITLHKGSCMHGVSRCGPCRIPRQPGGGATRRSTFAVNERCKLTIYPHVILNITGSTESNDLTPPHMRIPSLRLDSRFLVNT